MPAHDVLHLAGDLVGPTFAFQLLVAGQLAGGFLDLAAEILRGDLPPRSLSTMCLSSCQLPLEEWLECRLRFRRAAASAAEP